MSKVKVTADAAGNVIVPSKKNSEYGHIRVVQDRFVHDERGFMRRKTISALVVGLIVDLQARGWQKGQELDGKIVFHESLEPFNTKEPARDYKIAGKTGIVCCQDGQPIYRKTFYTENAGTVDVTVEHTNKEEIKEAYEKVEEKEENLDLNNI
jgi:hypothetical protein